MLQQINHKEENYKLEISHISGHSWPWSVISAVYIFCISSFILGRMLNPKLAID